MNKLKLFFLVSVFGLLTALLLLPVVPLKARAVNAQNGYEFKAQLMPVQGGGVLMYVDEFPPIPEPKPIEIFCIGDHCQFTPPISPEPQLPYEQPAEIVYFCIIDGELTECPPNDNE